MGACKPRPRKELKTFGVGDDIDQENSNRVHLVSTLGKSSFSPQSSWVCRNRMSGSRWNDIHVVFIFWFLCPSGLSGSLAPAGGDFRVKPLCITNEVQNGGRTDSRSYSKIGGKVGHEPGAPGPDKCLAPSPLQVGSAHLLTLERQNKFIQIALLKAFM